MSGMNLPSIPPLTASNWLRWSDLVNSRMVIADLGHIISDPRTEDDFVGRSLKPRTMAKYLQWYNDTTKCLAYLTNFVGEEFQPLISDCTTAFEALSALRSRMLAMSTLGVSSLYGEIHATRKAPHVPVQQHLDQMHAQKQRLHANGGTRITDEQWQLVLINSVPPHGGFENAVMNLSRLVNSGNCSVDEITHQLLESERIIALGKNTSPSTARPMVETMTGPFSANFTSGTFHTGVNSRVSNQPVTQRFHQPAARTAVKSRPTCDHCHQQGHLKATCYEIIGFPPRRKPSRSQGLRSGKKLVRYEHANATMEEPSLDDPNWAFPYQLPPTDSALITITARINITVVEGKVPWYVDSAASQHFCSDVSLFTTCNRIPQIPIKLGDESVIYAVGTGQVTLNITDDTNRPSSLTLDNVLLVPSLALNLISVPQLVAANFAVPFTKQGCLISDVNHKVVARAAHHQSSGLYALLTDSPATTENGDPGKRQRFEQDTTISTQPSVSARTLPSSTGVIHQQQLSRGCVRPAQA